MIDGNENFTLDTALTVADRLSDLGIEWFEEPIPQESPEVIAALCARSPVPIAYGEHMFGATEFEIAASTYGISVLQPDVATCGGISEAMLIAGLAKAAGLRLAPHTASGPIALAANLHFGAAAGASVVEYPFPLAECWSTIAPTCPLSLSAVIDGSLSLPAGPGLGVEVDLEAVRDHPYHPPAPRLGPSTRFMGNV
jgi:L-alanine-DL-glutamate epimerase-like enolase superfamily enzyme